ncbi:MAG: hypothetical protein AAFX02_00680 [Pseudomonadota bacterium]
MSGLSDTRGTTDRGIDDPTLGEWISSWVDWSWDLLKNSTIFLSGVEWGMLYGKPIFNAAGQEIGRAPGLIPPDIDAAKHRLWNTLGAGTLGGMLYPKAYLTGFYEGLRNQIVGLVKLVGSLFDGTLYQMTSLAFQSLMESERTAFFLGQEIGGGMVSEISNAADGSLQDFMYAVGRFMGSIFLDIMAAILTSGGSLIGTGLKKLGQVGGKMVTGVARTTGRLTGSASLSVDAAREFGEALIDVSTRPGFAEALAHSINMAPNRQLANAPAGFMDKGPSVFLSEAMDQARQRTRQRNATGGRQKPKASTDQAQGSKTRGTEDSGTAQSQRSGSHSRQATPTSGKQSGLLDFALSEAAFTGARLQNLPESGPFPPNEEALGELWALRHGTFGLTPEELIAALYGSTGNHPELGALFNFLRRGSGTLPPQYRDLHLRLAQMNSYAGTGGVQFMGVAVGDKIGLPNELDGMSDSFRTIIGAQLGIILERSRDRSAYPDFNRNAFWEAIRLEAYELYRLLNIANPNPLQVGHAWGPGFRDETALGLAFIPAFVNLQVQAGFIRNDVLGILSRQDARLVFGDGSDPQVVNPLSNEVQYGSRRRELFGLEGIIRDYAIAVREAANAGRMDPSTRVYLHVETETWGDELLNTKFFETAVNSKMKIKPQDFLRQITYRLQTLAVEYRTPNSLDGARVIAIPGGEMAFRLEIAPPPDFRRVLVSILPQVFGGFSPKDTIAEFDRFTLFRRD